MAEKECIYRDAAIAVIEEKQKELCPVGMYSRHAVYGSDREKFDAWQEIIDTLESIPVTDVRPVVLCRDCKWTKTDEMDDPAIYCMQWDRWETPPDGFCWLGEKREKN